MDLQTMQEKIYAGFLGMNIGIRLGAPVEPAFWSYERIRDVYGEVRGYVKDFIHFAADDDANGPVFFLRCLNDTEGREPTPESVAEAWLNYAREGIGMFWWGGYGVSTEHTAYLNLKNGIPAPRSGSADQNGAVLAEQIGGQIFIDTWGLIAPGNPERAAGWARTAASVSHDGEGLNGAAFIAACIARAFNARSMDEIIRAGLSVIPPESLYAAVAKAVIDFHGRHPEDWRACRAMLEAEWGYDRYPGACHIIPNAGVCVLALCYGGGDFSRTVEIATMCSWDTDCNAGNVGTIAGVFTGLAGIPEHYRTPINDHLILSGISGYLNSLYIPTYCRELADWALRLGGEAVPEAVRTVPEKGIHFDFSLPGSTHGFESTAPEICRIRHAREEDALEILLDRSTRGQAASVFYKPFYRRKDFSDERYMPVFSPQLYPGQKLRFALSWRKAAGEGILLTPYVRDSLTGLNNRKTLESTFNAYIHQVTEGKNLYLFIMDLNDFKRINDTLGHPVGDQALVDTAKIITKSVEGIQAIVVRYGGDEFVVLGFFSDNENAANYEKQVKENFTKWNEEHENPYKLMISIGWSRYQDGQTLEELLEKADTRLYEEKRTLKVGR